jgi:formylglycine-generating enzyme required for sulfatase activity
MTEALDLHFKEQGDLTRLDLDLAAQPPLGTAHPHVLARLVEDPGAPLAVRLRAGGLLALVGDPRVPLVPEMLPVPGGDAAIGLPPSRVDEVASAWWHVGVEAGWIAKETPEHTVRVAPFWLGRYPVTNAQYLAYLRATGSERRPSTWYLGAYPWDRGNHPVCGVSAEDADAYAAWLTKETGHPYRLPTEAEWEHAAKGPDGREYPWGGVFDPARANTRETGVHTTTPVGAFPGGAGPFGHLDLAGNVEEYTADDYRPYPGGPEVEDHLTDRKSVV